MTDRTEFESAHALGAATHIVTESFNGIEHVLVPPGSSLTSMEKMQPQPARIKANPEFYDVEGFVDYAEEFKEEGTRIFVEKAAFRFFTIFDFHSPGEPAWGDHSASLTMRPSPEWTRWLRINNKKFTPMELAEFLEENLSYITAPVTGAELLTMCQNLKVVLKGNLDIEQSTQSGLKHLQIRDDSTLSGRSGTKDLAFPEKLELALRIFDNSHAYPISIFLRYRATKEGVVFWFTIPDPDGIEEQAFMKIVDEVKEESGLKTLMGRFDGPRHK